MPTPGYLWTEGSYIHFIDESGQEQQILGISGGAGAPGYLWIEGDSLHYIDESGVERSFPGYPPGESGTLGRIFALNLITPFTTPITVTKLPALNTPVVTLTIS